MSGDLFTCARAHVLVCVCLQFNDSSLEFVTMDPTAHRYCTGEVDEHVFDWGFVCSALLSIGAMMRRVFVLRTVSMVFQSSLLTVLEPSPLMKGEARLIRATRSKINKSVLIDINTNAILTNIFT